MSDDVERLLKGAAEDSADHIPFQQIWKRASILRARRIGIVTLLASSTGAIILWGATIPGPGSSTLLPTSPRSSNGTAGSMQSPSPAVFYPETYQERHRLVMPLTFPNGREAELVFPKHLGLTKYAVRPVAFGEIVGAKPRCGRDITGALSIKDFSPADTPSEIYVGPDGSKVELWSAHESDLVNGYLVFYFGDWLVGIPDGAGCDLDDDVVQRWIDGLQGSTNDAGFLLISATDPVRITPAGGGQGPQLLFTGGKGKNSVFFRVFEATCRAGPEPAIVRSAKTATWCLPEAGLRISANGEASDLEPLIEHLKGREPK